MRACNLYFCDFRYTLHDCYGRFYSNKIEKKGEADLSSIIFNDSFFYKTLCNFLYVVEVFFNNQIPEVITELNEILEDYYSISRDYWPNYGYKVRVIPKNNIEIIEAVKNEPSLKSVMKYYYDNDIGTALAELYKVLEPHREKIRNVLNGDIFFKIDNFFGFVNNYEKIRHNNGKQKDASIWQMRVYLDFGLSIYRLYLMNKNDDE